MKWTFKWSEQLESGIYHEQLLPRGFIPLDEQEPELGPLDFYLDAFRELSSCRPGGMGLQAIPFTAIAEYSRIYELGDFEDFATVMRLMDNVFIKLYSAQDQRGKNAANAATDTKGSSSR